MHQRRAGARPLLGGSYASSVKRGVAPHRRTHPHFLCTRNQSIAEGGKGTAPPGIPSSRPRGAVDACVLAACVVARVGCACVCVPDCGEERGQGTGACLRHKALDGLFCSPPPQRREPPARAVTT